MEYKVRLEDFVGPMDLLLYLIRKEEVDIRRIPIAKILDQYLVYLKTIEALDLDEAGEFVLMAATLMSIKARLLLPAEEVNIAEELDPRHELVQKLLEYKRMKELSEELLALRDSAQSRLGRPVPLRMTELLIDEEPAEQIEDLSVYDLLEAFTKVMAAIDVGAFRERRIAVTDIPVRIYASRVVDLVKTSGSLRFSELFGANQTRADVVGYFLAVLLLLKQQSIRLLQRKDFDEIILQFLAEPAETTEGDLVQEFN
jgi:segregation and condensation protein A